MTEQLELKSYQKDFFRELFIVDSDTVSLLKAKQTDAVAYMKKSSSEMSVHIFATVHRVFIPVRPEQIRLWRWLISPESEKRCET